MYGCVSLHVQQQPRVHFKQGSVRNACDGHLVGYIKTLDIEMANKHVTISPMFVISYFILFFVKLSVIFFIFFLLISIIS